MTIKWKDTSSFLHSWTTWNNRTALNLTRKSSILMWRFRGTWFGSFVVNTWEQELLSRAPARNANSQHLQSVFTWHHRSTVGVPEQRNGGMLVSPANPLGIELCSYANTFFCFGWKHAQWSRERKKSIRDSACCIQAALLERPNLLKRKSYGLNSFDCCLSTSLLRSIMPCQVIEPQVLVMFLYFISNLILFPFPQFQCQWFNILMTLVAFLSYLGYNAFIE